MISNSEYNDLLDYSNKKSKYFATRLYLPRPNGQKAFLNISGVDVAHDLIIKFPNCNIKELKSKVGKTFVAIYFESRLKEDPDLKNRSYKKWLAKTKEDKEYRRLMSDRAKEWRRKAMLNNDYKEKYNDYRRQWRAKIKEKYGKISKNQ